VVPFCFGDKTFNGHMIDLVVLVSSLPLVLEVGIGAFGDGEDCGVGGEVLALLRRLMDL
jgi:hypothetical protein